MPQRQVFGKLSAFLRQSIRPLRSTRTCPSRIHAFQGGGNRGRCNFQFLASRALMGVWSSSSISQIAFRYLPAIRLSFLAAIATPIFHWIVSRFLSGPGKLVYPPFDASNTL